MMNTAAQSDARNTGMVNEIEPADARARQQGTALLLDVREDNERAAGMADGAIGLARADIPARISRIAPDRAREIVTICASGKRSLLAAQTLRALGYEHVASVRGGLTRWLAENLPLEPGALDADSAERYSRHLVLPEVGVAGQRKLNDARVTLIGAGGLGSPAALYLAAAGVGTLSLIDDDRVERSNLQRQIVHTDARIGMRKTESARIAVNALNPQTRVQLREQRLVAANVEALIRDHDVVIDGADNFPTRYLLSAACVRLKHSARLRRRAPVHGTGQRVRRAPRRFAVLSLPVPAAAGRGRSAELREAGVLGVLPGMIGMLQATEAIKLVLGIGQPLVGRLLCYDALAAEFRELRLPRDPIVRAAARRRNFQLRSRADLCERRLGRAGIRATETRRLR